jgi:hypothetical protein
MGIKSGIPTPKPKIKPRVSELELVVSVANVA